MWIMVEPVAEIPFGIHWSPMRCYGCNSNPENFYSQGNNTLHCSWPRTEFSSIGLTHIGEIWLVEQDTTATAIYSRHDV
jgi:hypothetical protein